MQNSSFVYYHKDEFEGDYAVRPLRMPKLVEQPWPPSVGSDDLLICTPLKLWKKISPISTPSPNFLLCNLLCFTVLLLYSCFIASSHLRIHIFYTLIHTFPSIATLTHTSVYSFNYSLSPHTNTQDASPTVFIQSQKMCIDRG